LCFFSNPPNHHHSAGFLKKVQILDRWATLTCKAIASAEKFNMVQPPQNPDSQVNDKAAAPANLHNDNKALLEAMIDNSGDIMCLLDN
jgi:hypothetical protein